MKSNTELQRIEEEVDDGAQSESYCITEEKEEVVDIELGRANI